MALLVLYFLHVLIKLLRLKYWDIFSLFSINSNIRQKY